MANRLSNINIIIFILCFLVLTNSVLAHQPRIVEDNFALIENPEVSQAFYGELKDGPDYYQIQIDQPVKLYVGILVPDIENIDKDISVEISKDDEFYYLLDGGNFEWQPFHEEFAGDDYFKGPELSAGEKEGLPQGVEVKAGNYTLKVFSPDNQGKYVLVVGEKEEFPFNEMIKTVLVLPQLKGFFNKSFLTAYFNLIGLFMLIFLLIILGIFILVFFLIKRTKERYRQSFKNNFKKVII